MVEIFIPLGFFLMLFGIVVAVVYFRNKTRHDVQLTLRAIIDSDQPLSAELLEEMTSALQSQRDDLRRGVILLAVGVAVALFAVVADETDALGLAAFPLCIALAYLGLWWANGRKTN